MGTAGALLSSQGGSASDLLVDDPTAGTASYLPTYVGIRVTKEEWRRADTTLIKSIDYTYVGILVATDVRKVFASDGATIVAQATWAYAYTGLLLTSATMTRNV